MARLAAVAATAFATMMVLAALSAVFMLMTLVVFLGYGKFAAAVRNQVISRPRFLTWVRRTFAAAFAGLGARLAFTDR